MRSRVSPLPGVVARVALLSAFLLPGVRAQNPTGSLRGVVQDVSGGRVPSARIAVQALGSFIERQAASNDRGEFRLDDLPPGAYHVSVNAHGFAEARSDVTVIVSSVREITVTLNAGAVQQTVNVQGQASSITTQPLDTASAVHQAVVTARDLQTIPLAARTFANIAYLAPGTEPVEPSDPTKARITAVSSGGSSGLNNELSVDGGDNSDDYIGGFLQNFSPDAIQEFAVRTAQEDANTGRTTAGSVVITTKRGTENWHGDAAFYERAAALNARFPIDNPAPNPKQPFSRQNYVGALGGPIKKGNVWFYSSFEYVHEDASIAYSPASLAQFNALAQLAAQGLINVNGATANSIAVPSNVPVPFRDYLGTARFDWSQSSRSQWFLRAAVDNYTMRNAFVQQATLPSTGAESHNNYMNIVISQQHAFSPAWLGAFVLNASGLHLTERRNANLGFALAFPFTSTSSTISGLETFGDNQFVTPITAFPILRNQEKYQFRYDLAHTSGRHAPRFGVNFIHEPVLSGALTANQETLVTFPQDPAFYLTNPSQFKQDLVAGSVTTPAGNGSFVQNVQRLGVYAEDSWRVTPRLTVNYGLRYDTTFGLFTASGQTQLANPALQTLKALQIPLVTGVPHDYRAAFAPRLGIAYSPGQSANTVIRAGFGFFYNDLAQNGWVTAFQAVNPPLPGPCVNPGDPGCLPPAATSGPVGTLAGSGSIIDPHYKTPYALHATAGVQHAFNSKWILSADYTHEQGVHAYRRYQYQAGFTLLSPLFLSTVSDQRNNVPNITLFRTDNRSSYDGLSVHLQGNVSRRFNVVANYTLSSAQTWGCVLGELFDYVNGVCNPLHAFGKGDYGPSGEDVRHRFVLAGTLYIPGGFEVTTLSQAESARPFTLTTATPVTGVGDVFDNRAVVNSVPTNLDEFRGSPYIQVDMRVTRPFNFHEGWSVIPFIEFFNFLNRNNPGANFVTNVAALPVPPGQVQAGNITDICADPSCTTTRPITNLNQLRMPGGALGDFFGPGTTVGIPFAAQFGVRVNF
ncbi:MAG: carboxypeptidase regulatory-like domain-containing protein [Candidatus Acidiferrales bacterium]